MNINYDNLTAKVKGIFSVVLALCVCCFIAGCFICYSGLSSGAVYSDFSVFDILSSDYNLSLFCVLISFFFIILGKFAIIRSLILLFSLFICSLLGFGFYNIFISANHDIFKAFIVSIFMILSVCLCCTYSFSFLFADKSRNLILRPKLYFLLCLFSVFICVFLNLLLF